MSGNSPDHMFMNGLASRTIAHDGYARSAYHSSTWTKAVRALFKHVKLRTRLTPDDHNYNSRHPCPTTRNPSTLAIPSRACSVSTTRRRRTWPPSPTVEDEIVALAKEANAPKFAISDQSEACNRGSINQEPIVIEVSDQAGREAIAAEKIQGAAESFWNNSTNFRKAEPASSTHEYTTQRERSTTPYLETKLLRTPVVTRRDPSPYSFTPETANSSKTGLSDSGYGQPSGVRVTTRITVVPEKLTGKEFLDDCSPPNALSGSGRMRDSLFGYRYLESNSRSTANALADSRDVVIAAHDDRRPGRPPCVWSDFQESELRAAIHEAMRSEPQPRLAASRSQGLHEPRSSGGSSTVSRPGLESGLQKLTPLKSVTSRKSSAVVSPLATLISRFNAADYVNAAFDDIRNQSQPSTPTYPPTPPPPRSSRASSYHYKGDPLRSGRSSRPYSRSGSRPLSPVLFEYPRPETGSSDHNESVRETLAIPTILNNRSHRISRLESLSPPAEPESMYQTINPSSVLSAGAPSLLPYPEHDISLMPSDGMHKYNPSGLANPFVGPVTTQKEARPGPVTSKSYLTLDTPACRPPLDLRHTLSGKSPVMATASVWPSFKQDIDQSRDKSQPTSPFNKPLPMCPSTHSSRQHIDWYTLDGCSTFDICLSCLDANFASTTFEKFFLPAPRKDPSQRTKCDMYSPWVRLAWRLTQKRGAHNLELVYNVARIHAREKPCTGDHTVSRDWHNLVDKHGRSADQFDICPRDVNMIKALLPTLGQFFIRNKHTAGRKRKCNFRNSAETKQRWEEYLDVLIEIHETAALKGKLPDVGRFFEPVHLKAQVRECTGDKLLTDETWHFMSKLPEFTVCEECYSAIVWPAIEAGSSVANRFNRTPQLVHEKDEDNGVVGTSCQLYSPRAQKVFQNAVQTADFEHLSQRARRRKQREIARAVALSRLALEMRSASQYETRRQIIDRIQAERERIDSEWKEWE